MKKLLFLLLAAVSLCCCEKESDTTGKLVIKLHSNGDSLPMNLDIKILETNDTILDLQVSKKESSYRLNPGNYKFMLFEIQPEWHLKYSASFQIVEGSSVTFLSTNLGTSLTTN